MPTLVVRGTQDVIRTLEESAAICSLEPGTALVEFADVGRSVSCTTETGWRVVVSGQRAGGYEAVEAALTEALEEVRLRIANGVTLN